MIPIDPRSVMPPESAIPLSNNEGSAAAPGAKSVLPSSNDMSRPSPTNMSPHIKSVSGPKLAGPTWEVIQPWQFFNRLGDGPRIWDVRDNHIFASGHVYGSAHLSLKDNDANLIEALNLIEDELTVESQKIAYVFTDQSDSNGQQKIAERLIRISQHPECLAKFGQLNIVNAENFRIQYPFMMSDSKHYVPALDYPTQISDYLFLSSYFVAEKPEVVKNLNIKQIINVTPNCQNVFESEGIEYLRIAVDDEEHEPISDYFQQTSALIKSCQEKGEPLLVHCSRGASRSVSIVAAYLIKEYGLTTHDALSFLRSQRTCADPNFGFKKQLLRWEQSLAGSNSHPL